MTDEALDTRRIEHDAANKNCMCENCVRARRAHEDGCASCARESGDGAGERSAAGFLKENAEVLLGAVLYAAAFLSPAPWKTYLLLAAYASVAARVVFEALRSLFKGKCFSETMLMTAATAGALALGDYGEAVAVMLLYRIGEALSDCAADRSVDSIRSLLALESPYAEVIRNAERLKIRCEDIIPGDTVAVRPGGQFPADGVLSSEYAYVDTKSVTGEPGEKFIKAGEPVYAGFIAGSTPAEYKAEAAYKDSMLAKMIKLTGQASQNKAKAEKFITKFSKWYTPTIVVIAALIAVVPWAFGFTEFTVSLRRALIMLVISCPCALVISVPLCSFAGIGAASRRGVLIKGADYLETLSQAKTAVFDKTGTLTEGRPAVTATECKTDIKLFKEYMLAAESRSDHPLARAITASLRKEGIEADDGRCEDCREIPGKGVSLTYKGAAVIAGSAAFTGSVPADIAAACVYLSIDGVPAGYVALSDPLKSGTAAALAEMKRLGIKKTVMLTGDNRRSAEDIARRAGIDEVAAELLPDMKVAEMSKVKQGVTLYVGDGINDAPVIAASDVGMAMGALGSDAAIEAADVVIMSDDIGGVSDALRVAVFSHRLMTENIVFVIAVKTIVMVLGALGLAGMPLAIFADVGATLIATLNSVRVLGLKDKE